VAMLEGGGGGAAVGVFKVAGAVNRIRRDGRKLGNVVPPGDTFGRDEIRLTTSRLRGLQRAKALRGGKRLDRAAEVAKVERD